jgi:hypothetical protein
MNKLFLDKAKGLDAAQYIGRYRRCSSLKSSNLRFAEPKRGHVWMRRWLETHRALKALREAFAQRHTHPLDHYQQMGFGFANTS